MSLHWNNSIGEWEALTNYRYFFFSVFEGKKENCHVPLAIIEIIPDALGVVFNFQDKNLVVGLTVSQNRNLGFLKVQAT